MNYNELLNKMSGQMAAAAQSTTTTQLSTSHTSTPEQDVIPTLLNKIGLEVQRQGG